ncbi:MAG: hypothetical protein AB7T59_19260 [Hyphomonadaceae bacterium]
MTRSPLFGRRVHIAGSISLDAVIASSRDVTQARAIVEDLVIELTVRGANFVIPIDAEKERPGDGQPICFDWLVLQSAWKAKAQRLASAPGPFIVAVQHHKTELQIPPQFAEAWDQLRQSDDVQIENAAHWNMNSKRMEAQARYGDILIALGGGEGALFLANLYHEAGKPIIPLNLALCAPDAGARRLFGIGLSSSLAHQLFSAQTASAHAWVNRLNLTARSAPADHVRGVLNLLEDLTPPQAFIVRLLDPDHEKYADVEAYFETTVKPVIEDELGFRLCVIDGRQRHDFARIDQEIFAKLHKSAVVIADITGSRPNCFIELGYALGRRLPTILLAQQGAPHPFDVTTFAGHHWNLSMNASDRRKALLEHWAAVRSRPPIVPETPLIG